MICDRGWTGQCTRGLRGAGVILGKAGGRSSFPGGGTSGRRARA
jgi:hypothetical protein